MLARLRWVSLRSTHPTCFRTILDRRGFTAAPRIGVPGQYVFERAFVEK